MTNRIAQEAHDNAKSYYDRSQEYGYKFLMTLKEIRDNKYFLEIGFDDFENYTKKNFGYSRNTVNERIASAEQWGEQYDILLGQYGKSKLSRLAQFPETARAVVVEKGIPTENGMKNISEATVREIESYKKQLKQKDERISVLESAEPRVIEKRVEVPPSDYYSLQRANESLRREVETNVTKLANIKSLLDLAQQKYRLLESESREAQELKANIDSLRNQKESLDKKVKATFEFNELVTEINQVFDAKMASLRFKPIVNELYDTEAPKQLTELVNNISFWVDEMRKIIPNDNMKIIEGELL